MEKQKIYTTYDASKKMRNDWGAITPITRIIPNKKKPRRKPKYSKFDFE